MWSMGNGLALGDDGTGHQVWECFLLKKKVMNDSVEKQIKAVVLPLTQLLPTFPKPLGNCKIP